jgi:hypothetical protein
MGDLVDKQLLTLDEHDAFLAMITEAWWRLSPWDRDAFLANVQCMLSGCGSSTEDARLARHVIDSVASTDTRYVTMRERFGLE